MSKIDFEIRDLSVGPRDGWRYKHPISGQEFNHFDYATVEREVYQHNKGNGYEMADDWREVFQDEMCKQNGWGKETCRRIEGGRIARSAVLFASAFAYGKVLHAFLEAGGKYVSQEEAENRAIICRNCPLNGPANWGCGSCSQRIHDLVETIIGKRYTKQDDQLGYCGICHCSLTASVHYPLEAQAKGLTEEQKEQFKEVSSYCWKAKINEGDI